MGYIWYHFPCFHFFLHRPLLFFSIFYDFLFLSFAFWWRVKKKMEMKTDTNNREKNHSLKCIAWSFQAPGWFWYRKLKILINALAELWDKDTFHNGKQEPPNGKQELDQNPERKNFFVCFLVSVFLLLSARPRAPCNGVERREGLKLFMLRTKHIQSCWICLQKL